MSVDLVTDLASLRPRTENIGNLTQSAGISPTGRRAVFEARGEIFTVPAKHGPIRQLTQSPGVAERYPAWSPDGEHIAYWSDRSGEYELTLRSTDGSGDERRLTEMGPRATATSRSGHRTARRSRSSIIRRRSGSTISTPTG
ncbi:MAG: PD40 domain-containing protein [Gemmatimonadota bacterium]|nr:MAG: PD40 domain-containing protein [Gemmatimonadota bacterium]